MVAALICREYGWTLQQYEETPAVFIDVIITMLQAEAHEHNKRNKK